jgi:hypothetical protein
LIEQHKPHYREEGIGWIGVCPIMLKPGEEEIIIKRISEIFKKQIVK